MSATPHPLSTPRIDPTSRLAIARADGRQPRGRRVVRYDQGVRVRRGKEPLQVTLAQWIRAKNGTVG